MRFENLPEEVQVFIISASMLMDKIEMTLDDELIQDDYKVKKRLEVCQEKYAEMKKLLS